MKIRRPRDERELAAALALREEVFCGEQGVTFDGDHDEDIAKTIRAPANYPITVFFDRRGKLAYVHQGAYRNQSDLADDMRRYLS